MGLVHMPRVVASIAKGLYKGRQSSGILGAAGFSPDNPYVSTARVGLFDIDYIGHMNNASYLNHAEYARWEWSAENGMLQTYFENKCEFIVTSSVVRYRREIKPLFRKFQVHTSLCGIDDRGLSFYQTFRYPGSGGVHKIRAQVLVAGVVRRGRQVINPREFMIEKIGANPELIEAIGEGKMKMDDIFRKNTELEDLLKASAAVDDSRVDPPAR